MPFSKTDWWYGAVAALLLSTLSGCDIPTKSPSINTQTEVSAPLVAQKTLVFLGGPKSKFEPLIDTTSSSFDSLFTVGSDPKNISIVQEVDNFDIGTLNDAIDNASGNFTIEDRKIDETFIDLQKRNVSFSGEKRIGDFFSGQELKVFTSADITLPSNGKVAFDKRVGDYVGLKGANITLSNVSVAPNANERVYDKLSFEYPDIRTKPYNEEDSLVVKFVPNPSGTFERDINNLENGFDIPLENMRLYPDKRKIDQDGSIRFRIKGDINPDLKVSDDDKVSIGLTTSVGDFDIQGLKVSKAEPFDVEVSPNDGDSELDISEDSEVRSASFGGFSGITGRVDGLQLANTSLNFSVKMKNLVETEATLYTAMQGKNKTGSIFLAGKSGTNRNVSSLPFNTTFVQSGTPIKLDSLMRLNVDLTGASLGETVLTPQTIDGSNSNVGPFINSLPTELRFAGQARVNSNRGDLKLQKPVSLDAGITLDVPLQIKDDFVLRDTIDADLSSLKNLTDPDQTLNVSAITLQFGYDNGLPLGADAALTIADDTGSPIPAFSGENQPTFSIDAAPKNSDGAADGSTGFQTTTLNLGSTREKLRALAEGREIQLRLNMKQKNPDSQNPARLRADDPIRLKLKLDVKATVNTN